MRGPTGGGGKSWAMEVGGEWFLFFSPFVSLFIAVALLRVRYFWAGLFFFSFLSEPFGKSVGCD
jgi:hypothetical protein